MLRIAGLSALAEEAHRVLPDPVECNHAERFLARYSVTKDELISRRGGSP
jgi:hypothetical protein